MLSFIDLKATQVKKGKIALLMWLDPEIHLGSVDIAHE